MLCREQNILTVSKCKSDVKETTVKEQNSFLPPIGRAETMEEQESKKLKKKR